MSDSDSDDGDKNTFMLAAADDNALMLDDEDDEVDVRVDRVGKIEDDLEARQLDEEEVVATLAESAAAGSGTPKRKRKKAAYAALGGSTSVTAAEVPQVTQVKRMRKRRTSEDVASEETKQAKLQRMREAPSKKRRGPFSLACLSAAVVCVNVDSYKGKGVQALPRDVLGGLRRVMHHHNWLRETNIAFFLHEDLRELNLDIRKASKHLNDSALRLIALCCPNLQSLSIAGWSAVTSTGVVQFCQSSALTNPETLHSLTLTMLYKLDATAFRSIVDTFTHLTSLDVSRCSIDWEILSCLVAGYGDSLLDLIIADVALNSDELLIITEGFKKLKTLDLSLPVWDPDNPAVDAEALATIGRACGTSLRNLRLCGQPFDDEVIGQITKQCPKLRSLDLSWLDFKAQFAWRVNLTGEGLRAVVDNCPGLRELGLAHCHMIKSDAAIVYMAQHLPFLEKLNLTNCQCVTDKAAMVLADHCSHMRRLKLQDCLLNSCSIIAFGASFPELEYLDVRSPNRLNDGAWAQIGVGCKKLNTLLANMSPEARLSCQMRCPKLDFRFKSTPTMMEVCEKEMKAVRRRRKAGLS